MTLSHTIKQLFAATATLALAAGFAAAPIAIDFAATGVTVKETKAFARKGADDPAGHVRQGRGRDDTKADDKGGTRAAKGKSSDDKGGDDKGGSSGKNKGGKGRGGHDDGPNHQ